MAKRVLIVTTSHARLGTTAHPTGVWAEELTTPYYALRDAGLDVTVASVAGGEVPFDPRSLPAGAGQKGGEEPSAQQEETPESVLRFFDDEALVMAVKDTPAVENLNSRDYDAIFLPGGHGTMWDLPGSHSLAELLSEAAESGRVVSAVCHGPAGLIGAKRSDGRPLVEGRRVTGFTNSEEEGVGLQQVVPFLLEDKLRELGGLYECVEDWQPFAVRDGNLITGQNPQSSAEVARLVIDALKG